MPKKSEKGSALPMTIIISAILVILSVVLSDAAVQWHGIVRAEENHTYSYISAESAIERCFVEIKSKLDDTAFINTVHEQGTLTGYAEEFIQELMNGNITSRAAIDVMGTGNTSEVLLSLSLDPGYTPQMNGDFLQFDIGVAADATLLNGNLKSYGRKVYAKKRFKVKIAKKFFLNGALYTVGDLMVTSGAAAKITGDVYTFGTYATKKGEDRQDYYGGIYVKNNGMGAGTTMPSLTIDGSAFTYSLIRTGDLITDSALAIDDGSRIYITGDAAAQSIQAFGKNTSIAVGRNAYTFDDLELDGENSLVAVNGNYFGLSNGDGKNHDSSSAVVNAAPIYFNNSDESKNSRIVVNGDVIINGSTYRTDLTSAPASIHRLESASMAWKGSDYSIASPFYKEKEGVFATNPTEVDYYVKYTIKDAAETSDVYGYQNIFQDGTLVLANPSETNMPGWVTSIRNNKFNHTSGASVSLTEIKGYTHDTMAANGQKMYHMDKNDSSMSGIQPVEHVVDELQYIAPNIFRNPSHQDPDVGKDFWKSVDTVNWDYYTHTDALGSMAKALKDFRGKLLERLRGIFAYRSYPALDESDNGLTAIEGYVCNNYSPSTVTADSAFECLLYSLNNAFASSTSEYVVLKVQKDPSDFSTMNLHDELQNKYINPDPVVGGYLPIPTDTYYLSYNLNPRRDIVIDGYYRGILVTAGRVIIKPTADFKGTIIAAGRSYRGPNRSAGSTADDLPRVENSTDFDSLRNGDFAGVIMEGGSIKYMEPDSMIPWFVNNGINLAKYIDYSTP